jgi:hypothetical protein
MERRRSIWGGESYRCAHRTCTGAVLIRPWHGERGDGAALSSSVASRRLACIARAAFSELHRQSREVNSCALSPRSSHGICLSCPPWNFASSDPLPPLLGRDLLLRGRAGAGVRPRFPSIGDRYWRYLVLLQLEILVLVGITCNLIVLWNTNPATSVAERICRAPTRPGGRSRRSGPP